VNGPHCPKCGFSNQWDYYSGSDAQNPDALRCMTRTADVVSGIDHPCGYIYWRRNAPADAYQSSPDDWRDLQRQSMAHQEMLARRARVRTLTIELIRAAGRKEILIADPVAFVVLASRLDDAIEALTITQGRES
jgi:hypothetical protein